MLMFAHFLEKRPSLNSCNPVLGKSPAAKALAWLPFGGGEGATPALRLFCLPHAGGGASNFIAWRRQLPGLAVAPVQYPGRETRLDEPCATSLPQLAGTLADALAALLVPGQSADSAPPPFALLGYSLGAKIAFAVAHRLWQRGLRPQSLHVVAHRAPDAPSPHPGAALLPEAGFRAHVRAYGGTPDEVFDTPELAELLLPILRADFSLAEQAIHLPALPCPLYAYAGDQDAVATPADMAQWQRFAADDFALHQFAGGHFFARNSPEFFSRLANNLRR